MSLPKRPRGRPRQYDRAAALLAARQVFWEHGFSGTSIEMLCAAMGLSKPSLYVGFGNKLELYLEVLRGYESEGRVAMAERLSHPDLVTALRRAARGAAANFMAGEAAPRGCLLVGTAVVEAMVEARVKRELREDMVASGAMFAARFERAIVEEGFRPAKPPALLGQVMRDAVYAAALHARAGAPLAEVTASLDAVIDLLVGEGGAGAEPEPAP